MRALSSRECELRFNTSGEKDLDEALEQGPMTWTDVVFDALNELGGEAELRQIYEAVADRRPTMNPAWQAQIRKICQMKHAAPARAATS